MLISVYLLCVGGLLLITSYPEDESIWNILAIEIDCQISALKIVYYYTIAFEKSLSSFSMISASEVALREGIG